MSLGTAVARVRLCGGMLLMLYVICYLSNLSLGLRSLQLMERWRHGIMVPWQSWIGQLLLCGALGSHVVLGLVSLSNRRPAAFMRGSEIAKLALGLFIPPSPHLPCRNRSTNRPCHDDGTKFAHNACWVGSNRKRGDADELDAI